MRKVAVVLSLVLLACGTARAAVMAEPIPAELLQQIATFAVPLIQQQFPNPPVTVDPQADKAVGVHVQEMVGVFVLPDKNITAKAVEGAGEKSVPVAILATKSLSFMDKETVIGADKVAVADFNGMFKLPVFFLAVKGSGDDRTLQVFSKDGKPLVTTPLKKQAGDAAVSVGVKMANIDLEKKQADMTVSLNGAYEGTLRMGFVAL